VAKLADRRSGGLAEELELLPGFRGAQRRAPLEGAVRARRGDPGLAATRLPARRRDGDLLPAARGDRTAGARRHGRPGRLPLGQRLVRRRALHQDRFLASGCCRRGGSVELIARKEAGLPISPRIDFNDAAVYDRICAAIPWACSRSKPGTDQMLRRTRPRDLATSPSRWRSCDPAHRRWRGESVRAAARSPAPRAGGGPPPTGLRSPSAAARMSRRDPGRHSLPGPSAPGLSGAGRSASAADVIAAPAPDRPGALVLVENDAQGLAETFAQQGCRPEARRGGPPPRVALGFAAPHVRIHRATDDGAGSHDRHLDGEGRRDRAAGCGAALESVPALDLDRPTVSPAQMRSYTAASFEIDAREIGGRPLCGRSARRSPPRRQHPEREEVDLDEARVVARVFVQWQTTRSSMAARSSGTISTSGREESPSRRRLGEVSRQAPDLPRELAQLLPEGRVCAPRSGEQLQLSASPPDRRFRQFATARSPRAAGRAPCPISRTPSAAG